MLDTNVVSAAMKADAEVIRRLKATNRRDVALPQPVLAEIAYGIERLPRSKRRQSLEQRFHAIAETFERMEWTDGVSHAFAEIKAALERKGMRIEDFDAAIAAHALASDATLVTANLRHMGGIPKLLLEDWVTGSRVGYER